MIVNVAKRAYNDFELGEFEGIPAIKKISHTDRLVQEIRYYEHATHRPVLRGMFPRMLDRHTSRVEDKPHYLCLELLPYSDLGTRIIEGRSFNFIPQLMTQINTLHTAFKIPENWNWDFQENSIQMYVHKTENEYINFDRQLHDLEKSSLTRSDSIKLNGESLPNFNEIWNDVVALMMAMGLFNHRYSYIHGDFCLSNVLGESFPLDPDRYAFKFIDPRGKWGDLLGPFGDPLYDYAKLYHSLNGRYELVINNLLLGVLDGNSVKAYGGQKYDTAYERMLDDFMCNLPVPFREVVLVEGLIYVGMCARHYDSLPRQLYMYARGIHSLVTALKM